MFRDTFDYFASTMLEIPVNRWDSTGGVWIFDKMLGKLRLIFTPPLTRKNKATTKQPVYCILAAQRIPHNNNLVTYDPRTTRPRHGLETAVFLSLETDNPLEQTTATLFINIMEI
ncbi:hypothetical protein WN55_00203 [Dufourea novaeangliae]|uniref:Uncharacterized protein n=1 Tax=Dufourea novaeangliae TaxID=178035 RepID=A0A154PCH2_DUFNO|nr:hypothetical protein WN55_00203 [Dufourea novaeangliae]